MAKKRRSASRTKTRTVYRTAPRRHTRRSSASKAIPGAMATVGLVYANLDPIKTVLSNMSVDGVKSAINQAVQVDQLKKTAIYTGGAMIAGEVVKKYAPAVIKTPVAKIARKIPKVF